MGRLPAGKILLLITGVTGTLFLLGATCCAPLTSDHRRLTDFHVDDIVCYKDPALNKQYGNGKVIEAEPDFADIMVQWQRSGLDEHVVTKRLKILIHATPTPSAPPASPGFKQILDDEMLARETAKKVNVYVPTAQEKSDAKLAARLRECNTPAERDALLSELSVGADGRH